MIEPGRMIGVYQLTEVIGKGGFAEVWSALDTRLNRLVAIKIIPIDDSLDGENGGQFRREALMVTQLEHNHILPLYDFGEETSFRYLVMRYVTGGTLANRIRGRIPIMPEAIIHWMSPIAETLDYIHEQRIVHRDLKPGNILFDAQDVPYLADFGLARALSESTHQLHSAAGTPVYMPPEQFRGQTLSIQSDQYSLGILLYQLFTGTVPYNGDLAYGIRQIANDELLPDVTEINPELPTELNVTLRALTALDPEARPASASQVMGTIADFFSGLSTATIESTPKVVFALNSNAYRKREADLLLAKYLPEWNTGIYSLSRTHFILLDTIFCNTAETLTTEARSLMLRGAFETGLQIDIWWALAAESERKRAAWHALSSSDTDVRLRAINQITPMAWARQASQASLNQIGHQLFPLSEFTAPMLHFLECALPPSKQWLVDSNLSALDENLSILAMSNGPLAERAAKLIGIAGRTRAAQMLPTRLAGIGQLLNVYEAAGTLPKGYSTPQIVLLNVLLAGRQLTAAPLSALRQYLWAAVGSGLGVAIMVFVVYRSLALVDNVRIVNALGQGFIFGVIYGFGVWLARHVMTRLRNIAKLLHIPVAIISGGLVVAIGFSIYHQLVYDDAIDISVCILGGLLYVTGFVISAKKPYLVRVLAGAAGVTVAYLIPWWLYLLPDSTIQPPFFFDETNPTATVILVIVSALILSVATSGKLWLPKQARKTAQNMELPVGITEQAKDPFETAYL